MPCDKTGSGTEVVFATVATLSKDVFEAPHKDRHDLQYYRPMVIAGRPEDTLPQSNSLLSNVIDIPALTISSHGSSPNTNSPRPDIFEGHSRSASQIYLPSLSFAEPADQPTLCVIQCFVTHLTH